MAMSRTVLLTGFEPFAGQPLNPSAVIAARLDGMVVGRHRVVGLQLRCVFGVARRELAVAVRRHNPALVICLGQAPRRTAVTPERVAVNLDDARIPDNAGGQPIDRPIVRGGPAAYFSTLPVKAMVQAARATGVPAELSHSAGTFVCNHVFYGLMHQLRTTRPAVRGGFIHVPSSVELGGTLTLDALATAVRAAVAAAIVHRRDRRSFEGRED